MHLMILKVFSSITNPVIPGFSAFFSWSGAEKPLTGAALGGSSHGLHLRALQVFLIHLSPCLWRKAQEISQPQSISPALHIQDRAEVNDPLQSHSSGNQRQQFLEKCLLSNLGAFPWGGNIHFPFYLSFFFIYGLNKAGNLAGFR